MGYTQEDVKTTNTDTNPNTVESRPSLRERKKRQTRAAIIEAAMQYAEAQGYDQTSIDTISDAAEVSRGTFFNYFSYKEAVIVEWGGDWLAHLTAQVDDAIAAGVAADRIITRLWAALRRMAMDHPATVAVLVAELFNADGVRATFATAGFPLAVAAARVIAYGQQSGQFRADLDAAQAGQLFANAIIASMALPHTDAGAETFARQALAVLLHGALGTAESAGNTVPAHDAPDAATPVRARARRGVRQDAGNAVR